MEHPSIPEHVLCENCGYALGGLDANLACPECGRAAADSLPERRRGSPWQRSGLADGCGAIPAWLATLGAIARRPAAFWRDVRITQRRALALLMTNCLIAALGAMLVLLGEWNGRTSPISYMAAFWFVMLLLMLALSSVEYVGMRFFGRRRGWRITLRTTLVIVAHASYAWLIAGFGMAAAGQVARVLPFIWDGRPTLSIPDIVWFALITGTPFILGMVLFSSLCGLGFHALRYANAQA